MSSRHDEGSRGEREENKRDERERKTERARAVICMRNARTLEGAI